MKTKIITGMDLFIICLLIILLSVGALYLVNQQEFWNIFSLPK
jgi:hypothetical protein